MSEQCTLCGKPEDSPTPIQFGKADWGSYDLCHECTGFFILALIRAMGYDPDELARALELAIVAALFPKEAAA